MSNLRTPSTRNLDLLPSPQQLERLCKSLAMLDAILLPDNWTDRYYSFNAKWNTEKRLHMGSMQNGQGDYYFILFGENGVAIKGYDHECAMATPGSPPQGVLTEFPKSISDFLTEPAFSMDDTSFCIWHLPEQVWSVGNIAYPEGADPDGSESLLDLLAGEPRSYQEFAEDYYEQDVPLETVEAVYSHQPLTAELVGTLNSETSLVALAADIAEIGYPKA